MCGIIRCRSPFEIYGVSTASHAENKCSAYSKYASALFSAVSLYLHRLFQKAPFANIWRIYCVVRQKTVLDVSVSPRMAVVPCSNEICISQISQVRNVHGSTFLTVPAVLFCCTSCICTVSLQRLTDMPFFPTSRVNASDRIDSKRRILRLGKHLSRKAAKFCLNSLSILRETAPQCLMRLSRRQPMEVPLLNSIMGGSGLILSSYSVP